MINIIPVYHRHVGVAQHHVAAGVRLKTLLVQLWCHKKHCCIFSSVLDRLRFLFIVCPDCTRLKNVGDQINLSHR